MGQKYRVIGGLEVCNTQNGDIVDREDLDKAGANVPALLGAHLEEVSDDAEPEDLSEGDDRPDKLTADMGKTATDKPSRTVRRGGGGK